MILLGIDLETTGLKIGVVSVTEVGLVLFDTEIHSPIKLAGFLVDPGPDAVWEPGVEKINGITPELCAKYGTKDEKAILQLLFWYQNCDAAVAHNGLEFDRPILKHWAERYDLDWQPSKLWIDTKCDLDIPARNSTRLVYMAADHNFLNPFPHRALFDVMTMMRILDTYEIDKVVEVSRSPALLVKALVSYDTRELAKQRGFHWQAEDKIWTMVVKECHLERERESCKVTGFDIEILPRK